MSSVERPHLSATQLDCLFTCGERYRRRYVEGEKIAPGIALLIGSCTHKGIEINFRQKIASHQNLPRRDVVEAAVAGIHSTIAEDGVELDAAEQSRGRDAVVGDAVDSVAMLAGLHYDTQAQDYQPVAIEKEILIPFPNATHDMMGFIDLVDDHERVIDFKTAGKSKSQTDADSSVQLTIYAASHWREHARMPSECRLDVLVKTKTPKRQIVTTQRDPTDLRALLARVNAALTIIQAGNYGPCVPGHWQCSPKYCGYFRTCRFVNGERAAAAAAE